MRNLLPALIGSLLIIELAAISMALIVWLVLAWFGAPLSVIIAGESLGGVALLILSWFIIRQALRNARAFDEEDRARVEAG